MSQFFLEFFIKSIELLSSVIETGLNRQMQPSKGVLRKRYSENMKQICKTTPMSKCNFNKVSKQLY